CTGTAIVQRQIPSVMPMPDTWNRVLGFLDWTEADMTESEIQANALNYYFIWGGGAWEADHFRSVNSTINVGRYMPAFLDYQNSRPEPYTLEGDTPERRARSLQWWNTEVDGVGHPDWVMYRCDRVTPAYQVIDSATLSNVPLDITNSQVISWQLRTGAPVDERGFTALSSDMVSLRNFNHACDIYCRAQWVQLVSGEDSDPVFASAVLDWSRQIRAGLRTLPSPRGLVANFVPFYFFSDQEIASLAANLDGILDEQGFTGFGLGRIHASGEL